MTAKLPHRDRVKAVVFDKDGVLADSEAINIQSAFEVFGAHGYGLRPEDRSLIVGRHPIDYVPELARRFDIGEDRRRTMIAEQDVIYTRAWQEQGRLLDGAREALDVARRRGFHVGLATSSSRREVQEFLERFDLGRCFDATLTLDDVTRAKPDPEIYLATARQLKIEPSEMLVIEDSEHGVRAAKSAGATCIAVHNPHISAECTAEADAHIPSLTELPALLAHQPA